MLLYINANSDKHANTWLFTPCKLWANLVRWCWNIISVGGATILFFLTLSLSRERYFLVSIIHYSLFPTENTSYQDKQHYGTGIFYCIPTPKRIGEKRGYCFNRILWTPWEIRVGLVEYKIQNSLFYIIYKLIVFLFFSFCGRKIRRKLALFYAKDCIMYLFYMVLYGKVESVFIVYFHVYTNKLRLFYYYDCINKCAW